MVLDESMRLYPPAWATSRAAVADDELGGRRTEAKSVVFLSPYLTHRHVEFWPDPDRFDPERFTPDRVAARSRYAYFPFGGGLRLCIGNSFALTEAVLVLAMLAPRFELRTQHGYAVTPEPLITLRPRGGIPMTLREIPSRS
jgi:cytochrome P450